MNNRLLFLLLVYCLTKDVKAQEKVALSQEQAAAVQGRGTSLFSICPPVAATPCSDTSSALCNGVTCRQFTFETPTGYAFVCVPTPGRRSCSSVITKYKTCSFDISSTCTSVPYADGGVCGNITVASCENDGVDCLPCIPKTGISGCPSDCR